MNPHNLALRRWSGGAALLAAALLSACGGSGNDTPSAATRPDFGPNVTIFEPTMGVDAINTKLRALAAQSDGFDDARSAVYFMPGTYGSDAGRFSPATATGHVDSPVGFMMTVQGLGASPDAVTVNGNLRVGSFQVGALSTFWRSLANLKINPIQADVPAFTMRWNTSQASSLRRVHVDGHLDLTGGTSFGSYIANSRVEGELRFGAAWQPDRNPPVTGTVEGGPAQFMVRDGAVGAVQGREVSLVFSGVEGAPAAAFAPGDKTVLASTTVSRDAPFLYADGTQFKVFVPAVARNTRGLHWGTAASDGKSLPITDFFIGRPEHSAATLNAALQNGKHLLLTPGVYRIDQPIRVQRANTVVLGMGLATLTPTTGTAAIVVDDVPGVVLASLVVDANTTRSDVLVQVGSASGRAGDAANPSSLIDVYVRVGGPSAGRVGTAVVVQQNHVVIDHTWIWRGDHGNAGTTGWAISIDRNARRGGDARTRFETAEGVRAMQSYVSRNWNTCGQPRDCHKTYHYADVAYQHRRYKMGYVGTNDHDLVHAINAAIAELQGQPVLPPFSIASRGEALRLLAHFIGDLHQPLHVGALYLDAAGATVDPDVPGSTEVLETRGGNSIDTGHGNNLHALWDDLPDALRADAVPAHLLQAARVLRKSRAGVGRLAQTWASDTVAVSGAAFAGLSLGPASVGKGGRVWPATFANLADYRARLDAVQTVQLTKAGARLAQLVNALYAVPR